MRGIAKGEQASLTNPILQLICRSGGVLADLYSGTFRIEDIRSPSTEPVVKVATTPFVAGTHKVGTGRYAIPTGSTATWGYGTHRAVCEYVMASGGPTYTQVIEFEVLDPVDWPSGRGYVGYLSTRLAYADGYATRAQASPQRLHRNICTLSRRVERYTQRFFEPRYVHALKAGADAAALILNQPIIAIEDVYAVWQTTSGENTYKFEQYLYKVYNRHLDGYLETDDRQHPKIVLTNVDGTIVKVNGFAWPYGNQNIQVRGVFGYTEPDIDEGAGQVAIGRTPRDIFQVVGSLLARSVEDPARTSLTTWSPGSISEYRTRDQAIKFGGGASSSSSRGGGSGSELTGDALVDEILLRYCAPAAFGAV